MKEHDYYRATVTDTFCGEPNFCWTRRYLIRAKSMTGAMRKLNRVEGATFRKQHDYGDGAIYKLPGAHICAIVDYDGFHDGHDTFQSYRHL